MLDDTNPYINGLDSTTSGLLDTVMNLGSNILLIYNSLTGDVDFLNRKGLAFFGAENEAEGLSKDAFVRGVVREDYNRLTDALARVASQVEPLSTDVVVRLHDSYGDIHWFAWKFAPLFNQGEFEGQIVLLGEDVTKAKLEAITIARNNEFMHAISLLSPNYTYVYDIESQHNSYSNKDLLSTLGYQLD